jgi:hypothetical protein
VKPLVLVEGVPGSGKTTTAELIATQTGARWIREEARDHPVIPAEVRKRNRGDDFETQCLARWRDFLHALDGPWVLEGCALQSTVRFMFANCWPRPRIDAYWQAFEEIVAPFVEKLLLLTVSDERMREVYAERGDAWIAKVGGWVASTPRGGTLVEFGLAYGALSEELLARSTLPVERR